MVKYFNNELKNKYWKKLFWTGMKKRDKARP